MRTVSPLATSIDFTSPSITPPLTLMRVTGGSAGASGWVSVSVSAPLSAVVCVWLPLEDGVESSSSPGWATTNAMTATTSAPTTSPIR